MRSVKEEILKSSRVKYINGCVHVSFDDVLIISIVMIFLIMLHIQLFIRVYHAIYY